MKKIGVLSDTHRVFIDTDYTAQCSHAFADCDVIIHAGDLTDPVVLEPFKNKQVFAVAGNMCNSHTRRLLPSQRIFTIDGVHFALCHGTGNRDNIADRMFEMFTEVDCIIFGHSHQPLYTTIGTTLLINPGSFLASSRYGQPGSYALLELDNNNISGSINYLPL